MIHLALLADAALLLVLLRMVWIGADRSCPREFFFLLSLLCYALLSFAEDFPAWGHATLAFFALPMLVDATKKFPARYARLIAALAVSAAAMLFGPASLARWGNSPAAHWALLGVLLELAAGIVLVVPAFRHLYNSAISRLRFFIGLHLLLVNLSAFTGVPFPATVFAATLVWLVTAATLAPTPDALVNEERLAISASYYNPATLLMARYAAIEIANPKHQAITLIALLRSFLCWPFSEASSAFTASTSTAAAPRMAPKNATTAEASSNFRCSEGCGAILSAKPSTTAIPAQDTPATSRATSERAAFMGGFSAKGR